MTFTRKLFAFFRRVR